MKVTPLIAFAFATTLVSTPAMAADDVPFLTEAIKGDNTEVALGQLAEKRGVSPQTRKYGAMLVHDHGAHRTMIIALDRKLGIIPTMALSDDGAKAKAMLGNLHGAKFDAAFKEHMIADHTQDIVKYEAAAHSAQSPRTRALAQQTLPTLHNHLDHANAL